MGSISSILPIVVGALTPGSEEEYDLWKINCKENTSDHTDSMSGVDVELLFPCNDDDIVPLSGGAIVKLSSLTNEVFTAPGAKTDDSSEEASVLRRTYAAKIAAYNTRVAVLATQVEGIESDDATMPNITSITDLVGKIRLGVNKALRGMPSTESLWAHAGVPSLSLSSYRSTDGSVSNADDLNGLIENAANDKIRLAGLNKVGSFKYIPIDVLIGIINAISGNDGAGEGDITSGMYNVAGFSGKTFGEISSSIWNSRMENADFEDSDIVDLLLEVFPIYHIDERHIIGPADKGSIGYYTVYKNSIYIKMPDLSGKNTPGFSLNTYDLGVEGGDEITFCFEMMIPKSQVPDRSWFSFDSKPPPAPELESTEERYPSSGGLEISFYAEGVDQDKMSDYTFYLSPVVQPQFSSKYTRFLYPRDDELEIFTAPVLYKSYFKDGLSTLLSVYSAVDGLEDSETLLDVFKANSATGIAYHPAVNIYKSLATFLSGTEMFKNPDTGEAGDGSVSYEFDDMLTMTFGKNEYKIDDLGLPSVISLGGVGSTLDALIGEKNRPDILLKTVMGDDAEKKIKSNDDKFFTNKLTSMRPVLASNRPNIYSKNLIPSLWIENSGTATSVTEDGEELIKVTFDSESFSSKYRDNGELKFAVYVMDELGQMSKAPGPYLHLDFSVPEISSISPNGFKDGGVVVASTDFVQSFTFSGSEMTDVAGMEFCGKEGEDCLNYVSFDSGQFGSMRTDTRIMVTSSTGILTNAEDGTYGDMTGLGSNVGVVYVRLVGENGSRSNRVKLNVSTTDTDLNDLDSEGEAVAEIKDPLSTFKASKFSSGCIEGLPVLQDGQSAKIKIKAAQALFGGLYDLYAYLVIPQVGVQSGASSGDVVGDFARDSDIVSINGADWTGHLAKNIEYKFSESGGDFYSNTSKSATILFPGSAYSGLNFSRLKNITRGYFLILNSQIEGFIENGSITLSDDGSIGDKKLCYGIIPIGDEGRAGSRAFSSPPLVKGLFVQLPGASSRVVSNVVTPEAVRGKLGELGLGGGSSASADGGTGIIAADKISKLAVLFEGDSTGKIKKEYKVYLGNKSIKQERQSIDLISKDSGIVAFYKNITTTKEGWQEITVERKDKNYGVTYDSSVYHRITVEIPNGDGVFELIDGVNTYIGSDHRITCTDDINPATFQQLTTKKLDVKSQEHNVLIPNENVPQAPGTSFFAPEPGAGFSVLFVNPVKLIPNMELTFGKEEIILGVENAITYGLSLDGSSENNTIAAIGSGGSIEQELSLELDNPLGAVANALDGVVSAGVNMSTAIDLGGGGGSGYCVDETSYVLFEGTVGSDSDATDISIGDIGSDLDASDASSITGDLGSTDVLGTITDGLGTVSDGLQAGVDTIENVAGAITDVVGALNSIAGQVTDAMSSAADLANSLAGDLEDTLESLSGQYTHVKGVDVRTIFLMRNTEVNTSNVLEPADGTTEPWKVSVGIQIQDASAIKFNVPQLVRIIKDGDGSKYEPYITVAVEGADGAVKKPLSALTIATGDILRIVSTGSTENTKYEIAGKRVKPQEKLSYDGINATAKIRVPDFSGLSIFGSDSCIDFGLTNSNENRMRMTAQIGNDETLAMDDDWQSKMFGPGKGGRGPAGDLKDALEKAKLKIGPQIMDKVAIASDKINSFCDFSFHLTAELQINLRNLRLLYIPIKIIFCIIDVICALLNPIKLAIAIIRLFLCLFDLILLLPQIAVPVMYLYLLLHILQLLQCVILKILGWIIAINDIITAIDDAITYHNYPAIVALEETLNEHLFSLEADLEVLEPIITILGIFLELLQLIFRFPCSIDDSDVDPMCIDPSMIAGIIVGKVAPSGPIEPTNLLPMAQSYATTSPEELDKSYGNTPPSSEYEGGSSITGTTLKMPSEEGSSSSIATYSEVLDDDGNIESIYLGEENSSGYANVTPDTLRFTGGDFNATFGVSFTRSKKGFAIFKGPDPRIVTMEFGSKGLTSEWAYNWFFGLFIKGKVIDTLQTLDDPPLFLEEDGGNLVMKKNSTNYNFISPLDGFSDFLDSSMNIRPLTVELSSYTQEVDDDGVPLEELTETKYEKTFSNIPMVAAVDHEFNVYFIEDGGITIDAETNGIASIKAKMINFPTAPKHKSGKDKIDVFKETDESGNGGTYDGEKIVKQQANANFLIAINGLVIGADTMAPTADPPDDYFALVKHNDWTGGSSGSSTADWNAVFGLGLIDPTDAEVEEALADSATWDDLGLDDLSGMPFPDQGAYNYLSDDSSRKDQKAINQALDSIKVFDFPRLYFVDVRQCADEIAAACQAADMNESLFNWTADQGLEWPGDFEPLITDAMDCITGFRKHFQDGIDNIRSVIGDDTQTKEEFLLALQGSKFDVPSAEDKYNELYDCIKDAVGKVCPWVVNPLNTGFKLIDDEDEDESGLVVDPSTIDEDILDGAEVGIDFDFPSVTGAAEYASGIGDFLILEAGQKAFIEIVPRDSQDDPIPESWDATESISIEIIKDETSTGAYMVEVNDGDGVLVVKEEETYLAAITSESIGKVAVRASVCGTVIQAWADRGLTLVGAEDEEEDLTEVDCVPDAVEVDSDGDEIFAPGAIMRVDRVLTILFTAKKSMGSSGTGYGDEDRTSSAELAKSAPQSTGTKLEN